MDALECRNRLTNLNPPADRTDYGAPIGVTRSRLLLQPRSRGRSAWVERLRREASAGPTMISVHLSRTRLFMLAALSALALAVPAAAEAAPTPENFEGVTVKRYLMGRVKPTL